jgi:hypothetical protein
MTPVSRDRRKVGQREPRPAEGPVLHSIGGHLLAAGSKVPFGQLKQIAEAPRAEASFAISAGETAVFGLKMTWTGIKKGTKLKLVRVADAAAALASLARVKIAASEQPAG